MMGVAPNLTTLIGENVGAKLIAHAGGRKKKEIYFLKIFLQN
jgi:RNA processing factor Prp31